MLKRNFTILAILAIFLVTMALRVPFLHQDGLDLDTDYWMRWTQSIEKVGLIDFYRGGEHPDYPPVYIYWLDFTTIAHKAITGSNIVEKDLTFNILTRLPSLLFDAAIGIFLFLILKKKYGEEKAFGIGILYAVLLPFIYDGAVWGQVDSIHTFFVLLTLLIAVPSAIKVFNWLTTLWRGNIRFTPGMLFAIGFVSLFISGGLTGVFLGNSALDLHLHDTYFIVAHFHIVMGVASFFGMFAGIYHWFPKMFGRYLNNTMAYIHFWVTIIGAYLIFWPMHYEGLAGMPRRYYDFANWTSFNMFNGLNEFISFVAMIVFAVQLLFVFNFFYSMFKGRKVTTTNPWGSNTLEWTTPINPGHGNWPGEIPEVHRGAYDYAKDGKEFTPQNVPVGADETHH